MDKKAIALFSGGLDSILAIKLILEQGIEVHAFYFSSIFNQGSIEDNEKTISQKAKNLGVKLTIIDITEEQLLLVRNPKHGMGSNMNPCIDCRILTLKKAKGLMDKLGAGFLVTGEVLGERPMSQRKDTLLLIDRKSGLEGLIVRPLSAKLLEPSVPEKEGIVDREKLFDIQGRKRDKQIALAKRFGIDDYPNPAGGCLLTDKGFSNRLRDILNHNQRFDIADLELLKTGRHFRISDKLKLVVGRDEKENDALLSLSRHGDYVFDILNIPGPIGLGRGEVEEKDIEQMASIIARYSDAKIEEVNPVRCLLSNGVKVSCKILPSEDWKEVLVCPAIEEIISTTRI